MTGIPLLIPRLADVAAGLSSVTGESVDLNQVSVAIGKSLAMGAGALKRYGVSMSEAEEAQFNAAEGMERVVLLSEILDNNFKGLAETTRDSFRQMENSIGDLQEVVGAQLRPELQGMADEVRAFVEDPQVIDFARQIGQAAVGAIEAGLKVFQFFGRVSDAIRSSIRLMVFAWRKGQDVFFETLQIANNARAGINELLGNQERADQLREQNRLLEIQQVRVRTLAQSELDLAQAILSGDQARAAVANAGGAGGGPGGAPGAPGSPGAGSGSGAAAGSTDLLTLLRQRRQALIEEGEITNELFRINQQIAHIEQERLHIQQTLDAAQVEKMEGMQAEITAIDLLITKEMERTQVEIEAAQQRIDATRRESEAKQKAANAELTADQRVVASAASSALREKSIAQSVRGTVSQIVDAKLAEFIARILAPLGPIGLVLAPVLAGAAKAMFRAAIPGFAEGGTVTGPGGRDNVLTRLTAGEEVINADAAARNRPLLKAINSGVPLSAAMGPMDVQVTIGGTLTANNQEIVAEIDETRTTIETTRGQVRTRQS